MTRYVTPRVSSNDTRGITITIPLSPDMLAIVRGFLYNLTIAENWQQIENQTITPEEAAAAAQTMLESFEASIEGS